MSPVQRAAARIAMVAVLLAGPALVGAAAAATRVAVAAFALWSDQGVFRSEASRAAALVAARYHAVGTVVRSNGRGSDAAGPSGMAAAIAAAGRRLDPATDVLVLILTSHGSPEGIAEKSGRLEGVLTPDALGAILARSPVVHKVLVVSACYSGVFTALAGPNLLVITAADATHPSFGCEAGATWTYFGRAFFDQALRASIRSGAGLDEAFGEAAARVRAREEAEGFEPSNPQIAGGAEVLQRLADR